MKSTFQILAIVGVISFISSNTAAQVIYKWQLQKSVTLLATKYELSKKGQVYYLKTTYEQDNSSANNAVILKKKGSKTIIEYKKKGSYGGEYHVIEADGQLGLYNHEGKRFGLATLN